MQNACFQFRLNGTPISSERYGNGHINETYLVITDQGTWYILQKINHFVFHDVDKLMRNIAAVTRYLAKADPDPRHVLTIVPTKDGRDYLHDDEGYWRMYIFVTDSLCLDRPETAEDFCASAEAFGHFQNVLSTFPAETLHEIIPHFHDTPARFAALEKAIKEDVKGRAKDALQEIAFAMEHKQECGYLMDLLKADKLPLRVTHNDTKLNNVLLDNVTRAPLCVIDLDTVMPGLAANDFGDSIRFGANTASEDEKDLSKVKFSLPLYTAYARAFLAACGDNLTPLEIATLPMGAKLMTFECGIRFLADYLQGDQYFHIKYPDHNLVRCRTQFKLVAEMEAHWQDMQNIMKEASK